jgi:hypothetical protein
MCGGTLEGVDDEVRKVDKVMVGLPVVVVNRSDSSFSEELVKRSAKGSWGFESGCV